MDDHEIMPDYGDMPPMGYDDMPSMNYDDMPSKDDYNSLCGLSPLPLDDEPKEVTKGFSTKGTLGLMRHLDEDNKFRLYCESVSRAVQIPESSVFISGLTISSSVVMRKYVTCYEDGSPMSLGLYAVVEQPSGTGKSRCVSTFKNPVTDMVKLHKKARRNRLAALKKKEDDADKEEIKEIKKELNAPPFFISNATPESVEVGLPYTGGYFSLVSAEKGLFNSMLGTTYRSDGGAGNNNDLLLHGYLGEDFSSTRVGRDGSEGFVGGSVCLYTQPGCIEDLLRASDNMGLAERFMYLSEPHALGYRDMRNSNVADIELKKFYESIVKGIAYSVLNSPEDGGGFRLMLSDAGHNMVKDYRAGIEPLLADGCILGEHPLIRGVAAKIDGLIYKLAANIQVVSDVWDGRDNYIRDKYVVASIKIANDLLYELIATLGLKGIAGRKANHEVVLRIFEKDNRPLLESQIVKSRSQVTPFKEMSEGKAAAVRKIIHELMAAGTLTVTFKDTGTKKDVPYYLLAK